MKKILVFLAAALFLSSCVTHKPAYTRFTEGVDFSEYTRRGFFITESNSVSFNYDPVGSLTSVVRGGYETLGTDTHTSDEVYGTYTNVRYGGFISASVDDALDELYNSARELGADGIINFRLTYHPPEYEKNVLVVHSSYVVSGMAIKRK